MTASLLTPAQSSAIASLPLLSARVLHSLLKSLYAEPGYSFTKATDIAKDINEPVAKVKGAISSLVQKDLVEAMEMEADREKHPLLYSDLHRDYSRTTGAAVDGDALRAEAIVALEARIAVYTTELAGKGGKVDEIIASEKVKVASETMTDLAMIAIFGRKAGLGWPVILGAMGMPASFVLRLRPVMKSIDASSVGAR